MSDNGDDLRGLLDALLSHQAASGLFELVAAHEPKGDISPGVTAGSWFQRITPVPRVSGLAGTGYRIELVTRLYTGMFAEDQDEIDPTVYQAVALLLRLYNADFELTDPTTNTRRVMQVDLLGAYGEPLNARAGYLRQRQALYRTVDVITPLILADMFSQGS